MLKHKTAYYVLISDWSSDVCSSDLDDAAPPARGADRGMMVQILVRALGRCEQFDVEAVEQRALSKGGAGEAFVDAIIIMIGGFPIERDVEAEDVGKDMVQPQDRKSVV